MIDPDIWQDEKLSELDYAGRLFFIGLITQANDFGKLRGNAQILKSIIFPYEDNHIKIKEYLKKLDDLGMIILYKVNGENFVKLKNWGRYQRLEHPSKDNIPEPSDNTPETITTLSRNLPAQDKSSEDKSSEDKLGKDIDLVLNIWNERMPWKINKVLGMRLKHLKERLKEKEFVDDYQTILTKILESDFLSGRKPSKDHANFRGDFDFIIKNETNYIKILEGKYDQREVAV